MREAILGWIQEHEARNKVAFWAILAAGLAVIAIGIISIVILIVGGIFFTVMAIGSVFFGRYLLRLATAWRQQRINNTAGRRHRHQRYAR